MERKFFSTDEIKAHYESGPGKFFSPETMRWWKSRILSPVFEGPGGVFFITSERFMGSERIYSVRRYDAERRSITTFAHWCPSRARAIQAAERAAAGAPVVDHGAVEVHHAE